MNFGIFNLLNIEKKIEEKFKKFPFKWSVPPK